MESAYNQIQKASVVVNAVFWTRRSDLDAFGLINHLVKYEWRWRSRSCRHAIFSQHSLQFKHGCNYNFNQTDLLVRWVLLFDNIISAAMAN